MTLWIVEYVAGEPGCPLILKGTLDRPWDWDPFDPDPAAKRYNYLRWGEGASVIDLAASDVELELDPYSGQPSRNRNLPDAPVLESVARFEIAESRVPETAAFVCTDVGRSLVCTDEFKHTCESAELRGMGFSPLSEYTKADFWD